jgi:hypothetical protein
LGAGGALGFAIVDLRQDISASGNATRLLEQRIAQTERRLAELGGQIAAAQAPEVLAARNAELNLGLAQPAEARVIRVAGSMERRLAAKRHAEILAAGESGGLAPVRLGFNLNPGGASRSVR